jgi:hypothetical protein
MKKEKQKTYNKLTTEHLTLENSFGILREETEVQLNCTVGIKDHTYGWFEYYDEKTGGDEWHAEGGLWFENYKVTDYDGVFCLTQGVIELLKENGFDTSEVEV